MLQLDFADAMVVGIGDVNISVCVNAQTEWMEELSSTRRSAGSVYVAGRSVSCECGCSSVGGNLANAIIAGISDVDVSADIYAYPVGTAEFGGAASSTSSVDVSSPGSSECGGLSCGCIDFANSI